ncbi:MAG: hypothetical protein JWM28_309 [Chitinophagaceae bacterium]|nr:hypothetical protein [Chitinophagaceae bacterium]
MFSLALISGYSVTIAAITGLIRFKKIHKSYHPFIFICFFGLLNEVISNVAAYLFRDNGINYNLYSIIEALLYLWLFKSWGRFSRKKYSYVFTLSLLIIVWIFDNLLLNSLFTGNSLFWVIYSFCLVFLSIDEINLIVMSGRGSLLRDSKFLICSGLVIFYSYTATIYLFLFLRLNFSERFYSNIYLFLQAINFFVNLVFALALLWAPKKIRFILPF